MIAELGHIALIAAFCVAILQFCVPLYGAQRGNMHLMTFGSRAALVQCALIALSFLALTISFLISDFSVKLVAGHSALSKPLLYKISGVWGNHEGSILLWVLILAIYGALAVMFGKSLPASLKARALAVQGALGAAFIGFTLFTSNPFERLFPMPLDGSGLNPVLQDPGLAIHPPLLYMGYVGFSLAFSFAAAALIEGKVDAMWARWLRPWVLLAWSFLTLGITIGSFWAYYELGWGGWWMWDPVENVSFMPWLAGTALLHSIMVLGTRHSMASWTVLLGISAFSLSLVGTFVVRSGVLVSVHAFAVDPSRGVVILGLLIASTGGALTLYAMRAGQLRGREPVRAVSREGGLAMNNLLLVAATATVFLGTFYPLFIDVISDSQISVGKPYFDLTFAPIMLLLIVFMGAAPLLGWREDRAGKLKSFLKKAVPLFLGVVIATAIIGKSIPAAIAVGLAAYLAYATFAAMASKVKFGKVSFGQSMALLRAQPAAVYGFFLAHMGVAIFTAAATVMTVWAHEDISRVKIGEQVATNGYTFTLESVDTGQRDNYSYLTANIRAEKDGKSSVLKSERRYYPVREMLTTEAGFKYGPGATIFAAIGDGDAEKGFILRAYYHPGVVWIWIGALMMALAGFVSLLDKRLRAKDAL